MPRSRAKTPAYKDVTLGQLRSFTETARNGSFTAAAASLKLAHPTVWKQVHALEETFGTPLITPHARGCRLTEAGEVLLRLVAPSVLDLETLRTRFDEAVRNVDVRLAIVAPPRVLDEDIMPMLPAFLARRPRLQITLHDRAVTLIDETVESGEADLGLTTRQAHAKSSALLEVECSYELDVLLLIPREHPLTGRTNVKPDDLKPYGLLNSRQTLNDPVVHATIERHGLFDAGPRRVETRQTSVLRRAVAEGLGLALAIGRAGRNTDPRIHEHVMSRHFGRSQVHGVRRRGTRQNPALDDFAAALKQAMAG
jgi:DNA-binding transcriptional LysR family regulator